MNNDFYTNKFNKAIQNSFFEQLPMHEQEFIKQKSLLFEL